MRPPRSMRLHRHFVFLSLFVGLGLGSAAGQVASREFGPSCGLSSWLEALGQIESGDDDRAVGTAGEISRYQMLPQIWRLYSTSRAYRDVRVSTRVADQHLSCLEEMFRVCTGREPSDFDRYVLWNAGPTYYSRVGWARSRVVPVVAQRAVRFANLRQRFAALAPREPARSSSRLAGFSRRHPALLSAPFAGAFAIHSSAGLRPPQTPIPAGGSLVIAHNSVVAVNRTDTPASRVVVSAVVASAGSPAMRR